MRSFFRTEPHVLVGERSERNKHPTTERAKRANVVGLLNLKKTQFDPPPERDRVTSEAPLDEFYVGPRDAEDICSDSIYCAASPPIAGLFEVIRRLSEGR